MSWQRWRMNMMTWQSRSSLEWWWVEHKYRAFYFHLSADWSVAHRKLSRENRFQKRHQNWKAQTVANICWSQKIFAPSKQTQASLLFSTKCVSTKTKIPFTFPTTTHTRRYSESVSSLRPVFSTLARCPPWSSWRWDLRPSCSSCSLRSSWTTSSRTWCLWLQRVRSSSRARTSHSFWRSSWLWATSWTLVHVTGRPLASPYRTCARYIMRLRFFPAALEHQVSQRRQ